MKPQSLKSEFMFTGKEMEVLPGFSLEGRRKYPADDSQLFFVVS